MANQNGLYGCKEEEKIKNEQEKKKRTKAR